MFNFKNDKKEGNKYEQHQREVIKGLMVSAKSALIHAESMKKRYRTQQFDKLVKTCYDLVSQLKEIQNEIE